MDQESRSRRAMFCMGAGVEVGIDGEELAKNQRRHARKKLAIETWTLMLQPDMKSHLETAMTRLTFPFDHKFRCVHGTGADQDLTFCPWDIVGRDGFCCCWIRGFNFPKLWSESTSAAVTVTGPDRPRGDIEDHDHLISVISRLWLITELLVTMVSVMRRAKNLLGSKGTNQLSIPKFLIRHLQCSNAKHIHHRRENHVALRAHYTTVLDNPSSVSLSAQERRSNWKASCSNEGISRKRGVIFEVYRMAREVGHVLMNDLHLLGCHQVVEGGCGVVQDGSRRTVPERTARYCQNDS